MSENLKTYKVVPRRKGFFGKRTQEAPALYIDATSGEEAKKEARAKSGLGKFNSWKFHVV